MKSIIKPTAYLIAAGLLLCESAFAQAEQIDADAVSSAAQITDLQTDSAAAASAAYYSDEPQRVIYNEYKIGPTLSDDTHIGNTLLYNASGDDSVQLEYSDTDGKYYGNINVDSCCNHTELDGVGCAFATLYTRPNGRTSPGFFYVSAGDDITPDDRKLMIEVDYYGNTDKTLSLRYIKDNNKGTALKTFTRINSGEWETAVFEIADAYFNGSQSTGLADGLCDFRIEANSVDTYIKAVRVYTTKSYAEYTDAADSLFLPVDADNVTNDFELPQLDGFNVTWYSDNPAVLEAYSGYAYITQTQNRETAVLTAKIEKDGFYIEKSFSLTVLPADNEALILSEPDVVNDGNLYTVTLSAEHASAPLTLIALSVNKTTGNITAMNSDIGTSFLTASVNVDADCEFIYYVFGENGAPITNRAPASVTDLSADITLDGVELTWSPAADDYNAVKAYNILANDVLAVSQPPYELESEGICRCTVKNLTPGKEYNFAVTATDHGALESAPAVITKKFPHTGYISFTDEGTKTDSVRFITTDSPSAGDSYSETDAKNGVTCRKTANRSSIGKGNTYLYFACDENLISESNKNVYVEVTYFDEGTNNMYFEYNAADGSPAKRLAVKLGNTQKWKTTVIKIDDAHFRKDSRLTYCDFRLGGDSIVYISDVRVISPDNY